MFEFQPSIANGNVDFKDFAKELLFKNSTYLRIYTVNEVDI